jgi:hypothetical protein
VELPNGSLEPHSSHSSHLFEHSFAARGWALWGTHIMPAALAGFLLRCRLKVSPACVSINGAATLHRRHAVALLESPNTTGRAAVILTRPALAAGFSCAS